MKKEIHVDYGSRTDYMGTVCHVSNNDARGVRYKFEDLSQAVVYIMNSFHGIT